MQTDIGESSTWGCSSQLKINADPLWQQGWQLYYMSLQAESKSPGMSRESWGWMRQRRRDLREEEEEEESWKRLQHWLVFVVLILFVALENIFSFSYFPQCTRTRCTIALSIVKKLLFDVESWFKDHHWCLNTSIFKQPLTFQVTLVHLGAVQPFLWTQFHFNSPPPVWICSGLPLFS